MQSSAENNPVFLLLYSLKNVSLPKPLMGDKKIYSQYRSLADNRQGKQDCQGFPPYLCHRNHTCSKGTKQRQNILKGNNLSLNSYVWHKKSVTLVLCFMASTQKRSAGSLSCKNITKVRLALPILEDFTGWEMI